MSEGKPDSGPKGPPPWMLSLADLISLLLTFFVMLFAMSTVKVDAWNEIIDAMSKAPVDIEEKEETDIPEAETNVSTTIRKPAMNLDYLKSILTNNLKNDDVLRDAILRQETDSLILSLPGDLLFVSGQAALTRQAVQALFRIGGTRRRDPTRSLKLHSGAVVVLGGAARHCYHGVDRIYPGSSRLVPQDRLPGVRRINLTLRRVTRGEETP